MIPTGWQIREGRRLAGLSQTDLTTAAGVGLAVIVHAELVDGMPTITGTHARAIQMVFDTMGIAFLQEAGGIGVERLWDKP